MSQRTLYKKLNLINIYQSSFMIKKAFKKTKEIVTACDLFSNSQLLRYGEDPEYKSANGGLCSLALLLAFIIIFTNTVISTINMTNISSTSTLL